MKTKTLLIAAGVTVVAALVWRTMRKRAKQGQPATAQNTRDGIVQNQAARSNLAVDLDPVGLA